MRKFRVRIFDFDGTCTTPADGADTAFISAYQADFAELLGDVSLEQVIARFTALREIFAQKPDLYGWKINGKIVAPPLVDGFVEARVCAQEMLAERGEDIDVWSVHLSELYQRHYLKYTSDFRPELLDVFRMLRDRNEPFAIVTNSDPKKVRERLTALGEDAGWISPLVHGFARKFEVEPGSALTQLILPDCRRPIHLLRRSYHDALEAIRSQIGCDWEDMDVIGDIAELDLMMPVVSLRTRGYLIPGPNTPRYELSWAKQDPRVHTITSLHEVIAT